MKMMITMPEIMKTMSVTIIITKKMMMIMSVNNSNTSVTSLQLQTLLLKSQFPLQIPHQRFCWNLKSFPH